MDLVVEDNSRVGTIYFLMSRGQCPPRSRLALGQLRLGRRQRWRPKACSSIPRPHPRAYGNFARLLGHYVRDERLIPLAGGGAAADLAAGRQSRHPRPRRARAPAILPISPSSIPRRSPTGRPSPSRTNMRSACAMSSSTASRSCRRRACRRHARPGRARSRLATLPELKMPSPSINFARFVAKRRDFARRSGPIQVSFGKGPIPPASRWGVRPLGRSFAWPNLAPTSTPSPAPFPQRRPPAVHRLGRGPGRGSADAQTVHAHGGAVGHRASLVGAAAGAGRTAAQPSGRLLSRRLAGHLDAHAALCRSGARARARGDRQAAREGLARRRHPSGRGELHRLRRARHRPDHRPPPRPRQCRADPGRLHGLLCRCLGAAHRLSYRPLPARRAGAGGDGRAVLAASPAHPVARAAARHAPVQRRRRRGPGHVRARRASR